MSNEFYKNSYVKEERFNMDLTLSENPFGCSDKVKQAIFNTLKDIHHYPHHEQELMQAIANHHGINKDNIILGPGANQLLEDVFRIFAINKGVISTTACFPEPLAFHQTIGGFAKLIDSNSDFTLNIDALLKAINNKIGLIYLNNPNNPTGIYTSNDLLLSLIKSTATKIVISEASADFAGNTLIRQNLPENLLIVRSFSKSYGLAGLRIGYLVAHAKTINTIKKYLSAFRVNSLAIAAVHAAIQDQEYLHSMIKKTLKEKQKLMKAMRTLGFDIVNSEAQTFIAKVPNQYPNATEFCKQLKHHGAAVVDCSVFEGLEKYIRITLQTNLINDQFISILIKMIKGGVTC